MDLTTLLAALVPLSIVIYWFIGMVKDATNKNWNGVATRLAAVAAAFGAVVLYAHSSINLGGNSHDVIKTLSWTDQLLAALLFAATAGTGSDVLRTFNRSDTTVDERLLPGAVVSRAQQ